jgi:O-antigen/teichoic acid export membrane protein
MFVLAAGLMVRASVGPAEFLLNMSGEQRLCAAALLTAAVGNVALAMLLVPAFGLMGAAAATSLALAAAAVLNYAVARRRLGIGIAIWSRQRPRQA